MAESNENLIGFIASTVETISDRLNGVDERLSGVQGRLSEVDERLSGVVGRLSVVEGRLNGIEERMATKAQLEATTTAIRGDIERVHLRLDTMEHSVSSRFEHVETELSRLRSAVYLLGKDRPDILRLLGHNGS